MKNLIKILLLCFIPFANTADNLIYISQSGSGLDLSIDQIGNSNTFGTSQTRVTFGGNSLTGDFDFTGDSNTLAASILQAASTSWTYNVTGDSNQGTFAVGGTGDVANTDFDYAATGDSNILSFTQGAAATATGGNQDFAITGSSNNINTTCEVVGCINNWSITGSSNDIDTTQTGNADHSITATITGSTNDIDVDQTSSVGETSDILVITATTSNGTIDIDQCSSGC